MTRLHRSVIYGENRLHLGISNSRWTLYPSWEELATGIVRRHDILHWVNIDFCFNPNDRWCSAWKLHVEIGGNPILYRSNLLFVGLTDASNCQWGMGMLRKTTIALRFKGERVLRIEEGGEGWYRGTMGGTNGPIPWQWSQSKPFTMTLIKHNGGDEVQKAQVSKKASGKYVQCGRKYATKNFFFWFKLLYDLIKRVKIRGVKTRV